jgi:hypothetical protein
MIKRVTCGTNFIREMKRILPWKIKNKLKGKPRPTNDLCRKKVHKEFKVEDPIYSHQKNIT